MAHAPSFTVAAGVMMFLALAGCPGDDPATPTPCPRGMAFVSGGAFLTGAERAEMDIAPMAIGLGFVPWAPHAATVADFCMDRFEFPNEPGAYPVAEITFSAAATLCEALGKRLCTEREFERACGGIDGWHQPYGPDFRPGICNEGAVDGVGDAHRWLATSGAFWRCRSPEGIYDLEGNLSEWVADDDLRHANPWLSAEGDEAQARQLETHPEAVVRGGTMWVGIYGDGCQARHLHVANGPTSPDDGFRCCMDVPAAPTPTEALP